MLYFHLIPLICCCFFFSFHFFIPRRERLFQGRNSRRFSKSMGSSFFSTWQRELWFIRRGGRVQQLCRLWPRLFCQTWGFQSTWNDSRTDCGGVQWHGGGVCPPPSTKDDRGPRLEVKPPSRVKSWRRPFSPRAEPGCRTKNMSATRSRTSPHQHVSILPNSA